MYVVERPNQSERIDFEYLSLLGDRVTLPNCPIEMYPHFNPSVGTMFFEESDESCSEPTRFKLPFFLERYGPKFQEWSVVAHETRPGHHSQAQGTVNRTKILHRLRTEKSHKLQYCWLRHVETTLSSCMNIIDELTMLFFTFSTTLFSIGKQQRLLTVVATGQKVKNNVERTTMFTMVNMTK